MGLIATVGTVALKVATDTAAAGIGAALGAFLGAKLFRWLKGRAA